MIKCHFCQADITNNIINHPYSGFRKMLKCFVCDVIQGMGVAWYAFEANNKYYWAGGFFNENSTDIHQISEEKFQWFKNQTSYDENKSDFVERHHLKIKFHPNNFSKIKQYIKLLNFV